MATTDTINSIHEHLHKASAIADSLLHLDGNGGTDALQSGTLCTLMGSVQQELSEIERIANSLGHGVAPETGDDGGQSDTNEPDNLERSPGGKFDDLYHDVGTAIRDAKTVAVLLSVAEEGNTPDINAAGFALERMLERVEELHDGMWDFHPDHGKFKSKIVAEPL